MPSCTYLSWYGQCIIYVRSEVQTPATTKKEKKKQPLSALLGWLFLFKKMSSIFNTNNTCNKYIRINLNIKIKVQQTQMPSFSLDHLKGVTK